MTSEAKQMDAIQFRMMFAVLHDMDLSTLEDAGIITPSAVGGSDWKRFNTDLTTFVLKLPRDRLAKLAALVDVALRSE